MKKRKPKKKLKKLYRTKAKPRIKEMVLKRDQVLRVVVPKNEVPVVVHQDEEVVVIAPAPKQTWMQFLFGTTSG